MGTIFIYGKPVSERQEQMESSQGSGENPRIIQVVAPDSIELIIPYFCNQDRVHEHGKNS